MTEKETETAKEVFEIIKYEDGRLSLLRNGRERLPPSQASIYFWEQLQEARKELEELKASRTAAQSASTEGLRTTLGRAILAKNELREKLNAAESELGKVATENGRLREENAAYEKKLETLRQFLCEPGKNRPLSLGYEVGSTIRYIEDLEREVFALRQLERKTPVALTPEAAETLREEIKKPSFGNQAIVPEQNSAAGPLLQVDRDDFLNLLASHGVRWGLNTPEGSQDKPLEIRFF